MAPSGIAANIGTIKLAAMSTKTLVDIFIAHNAAAYPPKHMKAGTAKLALLEEAEAILPVTDIKAAKAALRAIGDKWSKVGHVPRADIGKVEGRLRRVEEAIQAAEQEEWRRTDPSRRAFASETASKFQASVDRLEEEVAAAKKSGAKNLKDLEAQLANAKALVEAVNKHA